MRSFFFLKNNYIKKYKIIVKLIFSRKWEIVHLNLNKEMNTIQVNLYLIVII